jgi:hypothetical protein
MQNAEGGTRYAAGPAADALFLPTAYRVLRTAYRVPFSLRQSPKLSYSLSGKL